MNVQPSCCLDVVVYMLNCVFWRHILLEIEFKSRVDMGSESQIAFGYCTAVSPMSGSPTFDTGKKTRNGANLKLRHTLRLGGVIINNVNVHLLSWLGSLSTIQFQTF